MISQGNRQRDDKNDMQAKKVSVIVSGYRAEVGIVAEEGKVFLRLGR